MPTQVESQEYVIHTGDLARDSMGVGAQQQGWMDVAGNVQQQQPQAQMPQPALQVGTQVVEGHREEESERRVSEAAGLFF
jgi:hypothetical protein